MGSSSSVPSQCSQPRTSFIIVIPFFPHLSRNVIFSQYGHFHIVCASGNFLSFPIYLSFIFYLFFLPPPFSGEDLEFTPFLRPAMADLPISASKSSTFCQQTESPSGRRLRLYNTRRACRANDVRREPWSPPAQSLQDLASHEPRYRVR